MKEEIIENMKDNKEKHNRKKNIKTIQAKNEG